MFEDNQQNHQSETEQISTSDNEGTESSQAELPKPNQGEVVTKGG